MVRYYTAEFFIDKIRLTYGDNIVEIAPPEPIKFGTTDSQLVEIVIPEEKKQLRTQ